MEITRLDPVRLQPAGYIRPVGQTGAAPITPVLLLLGADDADEADGAARDAALELGQGLDRVVLLLDLGLWPAAQLAHFTARRRMLARTPAPVASGEAALHFHRLQDSSVYVTSLSPPSIARNDGFWAAQAAIWPGTRQRLLDLFGAIVLAAPPLSQSRRGLDFAAQADATALVVRDDDQAASRAAWLRDTVRDAGGRPIGMVLTGARPFASETWLRARDGMAECGPRRW